MTTETTRAADAATRRPYAAGCRHAARDWLPEARRPLMRAGVDAMREGAKRAIAAFCVTRGGRYLHTHRRTYRSGSI